MTTKDDLRWLWVLPHDGDEAMLAKGLDLAMTNYLARFGYRPGTIYAHPALIARGLKAPGDDIRLEADARLNKCCVAFGLSTDGERAAKALGKAYGILLDRAKRREAEGLPKPEPTPETTAFVESVMAEHRRREGLRKFAYEWQAELPLDYQYQTGAEAIAL